MISQLYPTKVPTTILYDSVGGGLILLRHGAFLIGMDGCSFVPWLGCRIPIGDGKNFVIGVPVSRVCNNNDVVRQAGFVKALGVDPSDDRGSDEGCEKSHDDEHGEDFFIDNAGLVAQVENDEFDKTGEKVGLGQVTCSCGLICMIS